MSDRTDKPKKEVVFHLIQLKSLLRSPPYIPKSKPKTKLKQRGVWGVKYISSLDVYVQGD